MSCQLLWRFVLEPNCSRIGAQGKPEDRSKRFEYGNYNGYIITRQREQMPGANQSQSPNHNICLQFEDATIYLYDYLDI